MFTKNDYYTKLCSLVNHFKLARFLLSIHFLSTWSIANENIENVTSTRMTLECNIAHCMNPSIAQLVERWTVVGHFKWQTSIGRWFESGSKELFYFKLLQISDSLFCRMVDGKCKEPEKFLLFGQKNKISRLLIEDGEVPDVGEFCTLETIQHCKSQI